MQFLSRGQGYNLGLAADRATLVLNKPLARPADRAVLRWQLVGADAQARGETLEPQPGRSNYLSGRNPRAWVTNVPHFGRVAYHNVYAGIDVVYYGTSHRKLEFDFVVAPRANPGVIELSFQGGTVLLDQGRLAIQTLGGPVFHEAPVLYQRIGGVTRPVTGGYVLRGLNRVGFQVGAYDVNHPLYIDPVLNYSSYLGGSGADDGQAVAVDTVGNAYLTGSTTSPDFPGTGGTTVAGLEAFVTKLDRTGSVLLYSTYLAGGDDDEGRTIAVDVSGNAYVAGRTKSSDFPIWDPTNTFQSQLSGVQDAFVVKLNAAGNDLLYSTYLGGTDSEDAYGVGADVFGNVFVAGVTASSNFPTANAYQPARSGSTDAFVTKLNTLATTQASNLKYSTYLGGAGDDSARAVAVDGQGKVYVTGLTASSNFPTFSPYQAGNGGGTDAFVAKIDPDAPAAINTLAYGSYLGGAGTDEGRGIAVDVYRNVYVAGHTTSTTLPNVLGFQTAFGGGTSDAYVAKLDLTQSGVNQRKYLTYLGGNTADSANAVAVDGYGRAYVTGQTGGGTFPLQSAWQGTPGGGTDAFVTQLNGDGTALVYSSFLGGSGTDVGKGIAAAFDGRRSGAAGSDTFTADVVVIGLTESTNFPTRAPLQGPGGGTSDAFVTRVSLAPGVPVITGLTPATDTGVSNSDGITTNQRPALTGQAEPGSTVTVTLDGTFQTFGTATADANGLWTLPFPGPQPNLAEGVRYFTATATTTAGGQTSDRSRAFLVTVDLTAPDVTVNLAVDALATTLDRSPEVRVTARDLFGLPNDSNPLIPDYQVRLEVDGNPLHTVAQLHDDHALFEIKPSLSLGSHTVLARLRDRAGNERVTSSQPLTVNTAPATWVATGEFRSYDPLDGDGLLQAGNVRVEHRLDLDRSPGAASFGTTMLVYNSETVDLRPVVQATVQTENTDVATFPASIPAALTWDVNTPNAITVSPSVSTTGRTRGEALTVAVQLTNPGAANLTTGRHPWSLTLTTPAGPRTVTGAAFVVNELDSPYGAGWTFSLTDRLVDIPADVPNSLPAGKLRVFGTGGWRFYEQSGSNYLSPQGDPGTLKYDAGTTKYTYRLPDGQKRVFASDGRQESWTSATGDDTITFTYHGASTRLNTVTMPDTGVSTWIYSVANRLTRIEIPGHNPPAIERFYGFTVDGGNKLTQIQNLDGGQRNFTYATGTFPNKVTGDTLGMLTQSWAYGSHGAAASMSRGTGEETATTTVSPAVVQGLGTAVASPVRASTTDGLNHTVRTTMDLRGRQTQQIAGDGGLWQWTRDVTTSWIIEEIDALGRKTAYTRDAVGYVTLIKFPGDTDPSPIRQAFTYNDGPDATNPRHRLIAFQDERNYGTAQQYTYAYYTVAEGDVNGGRHLKTVTNPLAQTTEYAWDWTKLRLQEVKNARGYKTIFETDASRRVEKVREGEHTTDQTVKRFFTQSFVATGAGTGEVQSRTTGQSTVGGGYAKPTQTDYAYDGMNRVTQTIEAFGAPEQRTTDMAYDPAGYVTVVVRGQSLDPSYEKPSTAVYGYDSAGRQLAVIEGFGTPERRTSYTFYDAAGNVWITLDARGRWAYQAYDGANRLTLRSEAWLLPDQRDVAYGYDLVSNSTSVQDGLGRVDLFRYDVRNRIDRLDEARFNATEYRWATFTYTVASKLESRTYGQANVNPHVIVDSFQYDVLNRMSREIIADNDDVVQRETTFDYDSVGNLKWSHLMCSCASPGGIKTEFEYDGLNRRKEEKEAANSTNDYEKRTTTLTYDAADNPTKHETTQADEPSRVYRTDYSYDLLRRTTSTVEAPGQSELRTTTMLYDAAGNLVETTEGIATQHEKQLKTRFAYDVHSRQTRLTAAFATPKARTTATAWDDVNQVTALTDPLSQTARQGHDELSRLTHSVDALGKLTKLTRDAVGNGVALTDPVGNTTSRVFDAHNRVAKDINPLGAARTYTYDATDNLTRSVDRNGRTINWTYDARNRPASEEWVGGGRTDNFGYTVCDCLAAIAFPVGPGPGFAASYDALGRPRTVTVTDAAGLMTGSVTFSPQYHADNTVKQQTVQVGAATNHTTINTVDLRGRLTAIQRTNDLSQQVAKVELTYNSLDQLKEVKRYAGTSTTAFSTSTLGYDDAARLEAIDHKIGTTTHAAYALTYDAADRVTQQIVTYGAATTTNYGYDATNQLTSESIVGGTTTAYSYDANGNRTMTGYQTGAANRLTTDAQGYTYTYDNEGNVLTRSKAGDYQEFEYDYHNLLTRARFRDGPGGNILKEETYRYDLFDRRIGQTTTQGVNTTVRQFIWDGDQVLLVYTQVNGGPIQLTNRYLHGPAVDEVFADEQLAAGTTLWALTDHLGSVRDVVDSTGTNVKHRVYDGFGRLTSETGGASFIFGYTGREFDAVVGLQYNRARYYDPRIGRWMTEDPIGFGGNDPNLYRYAGNTPLNATDPSGEVFIVFALVAVVAVVLIATPNVQAPGAPGQFVGRVDWIIPPEKIAEFLEACWNARRGRRGGRGGHGGGQGGGGGGGRGGQGGGQGGHGGGQGGGQGGGRGGAQGGGAQGGGQGGGGQGGGGQGGGGQGGGGQGAGGQGAGGQGGGGQGAGGQGGGRGGQGGGGNPPAGGQGQPPGDRPFPLQTGGNTISDRTAKHFGCNKRDFGRALEELKRDNGLPNNHHGQIMSNGDYRDPRTGELLGNILDYLH